LNPDIPLTADPFVVLTERLGTLTAGVVAPLILSPEGQIEDSARHMITPFPHREEGLQANILLMCGFFSHVV
jgi:hypothetical protein